MGGGGENNTKANIVVGCSSSCCSFGVDFEAIGSGQVRWSLFAEGSVLGTGLFCCCGLRCVGFSASYNVDVFRSRVTTSTTFPLWKQKDTKAGKRLFASKLIQQEKQTSHLCFLQAGYSRHAKYLAPAEKPQ